MHVDQSNPVGGNQECEVPVIVESAETPAFQECLLSSSELANARYWPAKQMEFRPDPNLSNPAKI